MPRTSIKKKAFDFFTAKEKAIIKSALEDSRKGKGVDWRKIKRPDV